jgi:Kef-type K+ transport system membrane component KefB
MRTRPDRNAVADPVGPRSKNCDDKGMVTAELVVVLPAIVLALLFGLAAVSAMTMRMRCADAAAVGARLAARGETTTAVVAASRRAAPAGAEVRLETTTGTVAVTVTVRAPLLPAATWLPGLEVSGHFIQDREPGPPP